MQIKYLKDAPMARAGDVKEIADDQAKVLILTGYAEAYKPKAKPKPTDAQGA